MLKIKRYAHYFIVTGLAMLLVALAQVGGGNAVWAENSNQTLPQMTPVPGGGGGGGGGGGAASQIIGTVTDLSTGKAGAGIVVRINDIEVRTDSFGDYSLTGLAAGEYVVQLALEGNALPAQYPATVYLDGVNALTLNLEYYSAPPADGVVMKHIGQEGAAPTPEATAQTPPVVTATMQSAAAITQSQPATPPPPPETLPETGGLPNTVWLLTALLGGVLVIAGIGSALWVKE